MRTTESKRWRSTSTTSSYGWTPRRRCGKSSTRHAVSGTLSTNESGVSARHLKQMRNKETFDTVGVRRLDSTTIHIRFDGRRRKRWSVSHRHGISAKDCELVDENFVLPPIFEDSTRRRADGSRLATTSSPRRRRNSEYLMKKFTKTKVLEIWWGYKGEFVVSDPRLIDCHFVIATSS